MMRDFRGALSAWALMAKDEQRDPWAKGAFPDQAMADTLLEQLDDSLGEGHSYQVRDFLSPYKNTATAAGEREAKERSRMLDHNAPQQQKHFALCPRRHPGQRRPRRRSSR